MVTQWQLIREVMNRTLDACEAIEKLNPDLWKGEYEARSEFQEDVCVGDFLNRFWQYPEGAARDIIRIRSRLQTDQKHPPEIARAFIQSAIACAEAIGVDPRRISEEVPGFEPHCPSAGKSIESQLRGIPKIQNGWMLTGVQKALEGFRRKTG